MEYRRQEIGGGTKDEGYIVKYESYLDAEIIKKLKAINLEEKSHKYLKEIAEAKTVDELNALADKWEIERLEK